MNYEELVEVEVAAGFATAYLGENDDDVGSVATASRVVVVVGLDRMASSAARMVEGARFVGRAVGGSVTGLLGGRAAA
jgi:hypothetical protein